MYYGLPAGVVLDKILLSKFKYRDRTSIVVDILDIVKYDSRGKTKTSIMRKANLNFDQVNRYLDMLLLHDYIKADDPLESHEVARYRLTKKGLDLARELETLYFAMKLLQRPPM